MKKIIDLNENTTCYLHTLENGLRIFLVPNKKRKRVIASYGIDFGSYNDHIIENNQELRIPGGVAHFLEHQLFNQPDGVHAFDLYEKYGAASNAYTSYNVTKYFFSTSANFKKNLKTLMELVTIPWFKEKSVITERDIILQEEKMWRDDPGTRIGDDITALVFHENGIKTPILGTKAAIKSTTVKDLYRCYEYFYTTKNMFMVIAGNFNPEEAIKLIEDYYVKIDVPTEDIKPPKVKEPDAVVQEKKIVQMEIEVPLFEFIYKIKINKDQLMQRACLSLMNKILFGKTSDWQEENKRTNLLKSWNSQFLYAKTHLLWNYYGKSEDYELAISKFKEETLKPIPLEAFERAKKSLIATYMRSLDKTSYIEGKVFNNILQFGEIIDDIAILNELDYNKFNQIRAELDLSNSCYMVIKPKKK